MCVYVCVFMHACVHTCVHVNLDLKGKQGNEPESPLFYFYRKKDAQVEFEPTTSCFQDSCSAMHVCVSCLCVCL